MGYPISLVQVQPPPPGRAQADTSGQEQTELDIAAKIAELERQNQEFAAKVAAMEEEEALMEEAERRCCRGSRRWIASHPSFSPPFRNAS